MSIGRIASTLGLAALLACSNGSDGKRSVDEPAAGSPPVEGGARAPVEPEAGDPPAAAGDEDPSGDAGGPPPGLPTDATPVEFDVIASATHTSLGIRARRRAVIRSFEEWQEWYQELYSHMTPRPPALGFDFGSSMVVAATTGLRYTGGHSIGIESIQEADGTLYVTVLSSSPAAGCVTTQMLTSPAVAVLLARREGEVVFVERELTLEC